MTKQIKKLIAIFTVMVISMFAVITVSAEDCSTEDVVITDKTIEDYKLTVEFLRASIEYNKAMEKYYIDYYKWQEECRKITLKYNKLAYKYGKAFLDRSIRLKELDDIINNGATEEIREVAKEEYKRVVEKKLPVVPENLRVPKFPEEPRAPENPEFTYRMTGHF